MKAIMISIQPKWCELIVSCKKTVEVRKTRPKINTPFKCYIYCTIGNGVKGDYLIPSGIQCGKVIGEFVCDRIGDISVVVRNGKGKTLYAWHIIDLVIYDKPRELSEFKLPCKNDNDCDNCDKARHYFINTINRDFVLRSCELEEGLTRPPQSWQYVEEKENENE